jgi:hypothetical protein
LVSVSAVDASALPQHVLFGVGSEAWLEAEPQQLVLESVIVLLLTAEGVTA